MAAAAGDAFGWSVAFARDVNADGYGDFLIGAPYNDAGGTDAGRAYLFYGGAPANATADEVFTGAAAYDRLGSSVAGAGDVNGDRYGDVIVGAPYAGAGRAHVYFGGTLMDETPDLTLIGEASGDRFGESVACAGDANGDGYADLIVGAPNYDDGADADAGRAYLYFGGSTPNATPDVTMTGSDVWDQLRYSVD